MKAGSHYKAEQYAWLVSSKIASNGAGLTHRKADINMNIPTIKNMDSPRSGRPVANQYIITTNEGDYFQSYRSIIAFVPNSSYRSQYQAFLDETYWNYSSTTSKYRNNFLGEDTKTTKQKIKEGIYTLINLNK